MTHGTELSHAPQQTGTPSQGQVSAADALRARRSGKCYVAVLLLLPLLAVPLCILLGKSDFFLHHGASAWVRSNDAVFDLRGRNCKVLVFGDSTAMTGIDPDVVQQRTRLPTCNISVTNAVLSVTDRLTLDHYLANNARPDVILVQFSPEGFQEGRQQWERTIYAEGLLELLRHTSGKQSAGILLHHPQQALTFAGYAAGLSAWYAIKRAIFYTTHIQLEEDVHVHNGFFTPPVPARTRCEEESTGPISMERSNPRQVVDEYQQYARGHNTVLVNVAPIPACDRNLQAYQAELSGVTSNALLALPIQYFNDQRHFTANGSQVVSRMVSDQVNNATGHTTLESVASANLLPEQSSGKPVLADITELERQ